MNVWFHISAPCCCMLVYPTLQDMPRAVRNKILADQSKTRALLGQDLAESVPCGQSSTCRRFALASLMPTKATCSKQVSCFWYTCIWQLGAVFQAGMFFLDSSRPRYLQR